MLNKIFLLLFNSLFILLIACNNGQQQTDQVKPAGDTTQAATEKGIKKTMLFFGNSLTAGYGLRPEGRTAAESLCGPECRRPIIAP